MIPVLEFGPNCGDHVLKETASLNDRNSSPQERNCAPEENHWYTSPHSERTSYDDWEWDVISGSDITRETNDETTNEESGERERDDFASGESDRHGS